MNDLTESFAAKVAAEMGAPEMASNIYQIMSNWTPWEWSANYDGPRGKFNPLAITTKTGTSTPLGGNPNQNGGTPVQNYTSEDEGAKLTAQFLMNGRYPDVVNWMKTGQIGDPSKVAQQIRTWGTTGFANQVEQGNVGTAVNGRAETALGVTPTTGATPATSTSSNTTQPPNAQAALQAATAALNDLISNQPAITDDAYPAWSDRVTSLQKYVDNLTTQAGQRDTGFQNSQSQFTDKATLDTAAQNQAQNEITNYQNAASESRGRATLNLDAQKLLAQWGTAPGKSSYTPQDLGSSFVNTYKQAGLDPTPASLNYTGTQHIDTNADLAAGDARFGAAGAPPTLPPLQTNRGDIPQVTAPPEWPSATGSATGGATTVLPPGYGSTAGLGDATSPQNAKPANNWWTNAITPGSQNGGTWAHAITPGPQVGEPLPGVLPQPTAGGIPAYPGGLKPGQPTNGDWWNS